MSMATSVIDLVCTEIRNIAYFHSSSTATRATKANSSPNTFAVLSMAIISSCCSTPLAMSISARPGGGACRLHLNLVCLVMVTVVFTVRAEARHSSPSNSVLSSSLKTLRVVLCFKASARWLTPLDMILLRERSRLSNDVLVFSMLASTNISQVTECQVQSCQ